MRECTTVMNDRWKSNGAVRKYRKKVLENNNTEKMRERKRDGSMCIISETISVTESFLINQCLYSIYVNPSGQATAEECDHNLSVGNAERRRLRCLQGCQLAFPLGCAVQCGDMSY